MTVPVSPGDVELIVDALATAGLAHSQRRKELERHAGVSDREGDPEAASRLRQEGMLHSARAQQMAELLKRITDTVDPGCSRDDDCELTPEVAAEVEAVERERSERPLTMGSLPAEVSPGAIGHLVAQLALDGYHVRATGKASRSDGTRLERIEVEKGQLVAAYEFEPGNESWKLVGPWERNPLSEEGPEGVGPGGPGQ